VCLFWLLHKVCFATWSLLETHYWQSQDIELLLPKTLLHLRQRKRELNLIVASTDNTSSHSKRGWWRILADLWNSSELNHIGAGQAWPYSLRRPWCPGLSPTFKYSVLALAYDCVLKSYRVAKSAPLRSHVTSMIWNHRQICKSSSAFQRRSQSALYVYQLNSD